MAYREPRLTIKPCLHPRLRNDGFHQVRVRLTKYRQVVFFDAGFTVLKSQWNDKGVVGNAKWVRRSVEDYEDMNNILMDIYWRATYLSDIYPELNVEGVRDMMLAPNRESLEKLRDKWKIALSPQRGLLSSPAVPTQLKEYRSLVWDIQRLRNRVTQLERTVKKLTAKKLLGKTD